MNVTVTPDFTGWARFWYYLGNVFLAASYFAKIPARRALEQAGVGRLTGAERFWYVIENIPLGAGYFAKIIVARAIAQAVEYNSANGLSARPLTPRIVASR